MSRELENAEVGAPAHGRMAAEDRRRQIVDVAMRLFSERGFRGTTTKEIAHAAGVSEAIIFRHFATKDDLYTAIIDHKACAGGMADMERPVIETIRCSAAEVMKGGDDHAVFEHIALAMMRHHENDTQFLRLLFYSALEGHQLAQLFWDRNVRSMYEFLGSYISDRQREGAFRGVDPLVAVRAFAGMIIHHSVTNALWDRSRTLLNVTNEEASREFAEILLRGINIAADAPTRAAHKAGAKCSAAASRKAAPAPRVRKGK